LLRISQAQLVGGDENVLVLQLDREAEFLAHFLQIGLEHADVPAGGHLDLAENVTLFGVDSTLSISEMRAGEQRVPWQATVSLPEMARGGIAVALATVTPGFLAEDVGADFPPRSAIYHTPQEAEAQALKQIALYEAG
jgi:hypothetical protein